MSRFAWAPRDEKARAADGTQYNRREHSAATTQPEETGASEIHHRESRPRTAQSTLVLGLVMAATRPLVDKYLERISVIAFEQCQREITDLVRSKHGVYALYKNDRLYYVGLAEDLHRRIGQHLRDKHAGRWNAFSLYLVRQADHSQEIETLLLRIANRAGNIRRGRLRQATNL